VCNSRVSSLVLGIGGVGCSWVLDTRKAWWFLG
jgi:hypothetical protein